MPTPHIDAKVGEIAESILLPGDPLRAKYIAENYLTDVKQFNHTRNMLGYTGTYKGKLYSINANEMSVYNILSYNLNLFDKIHAEYPDILEPAQMFLDGEWDYDIFKEYCLKVL